MCWKSWLWVSAGALRRALKMVSRSEVVEIFICPNANRREYGFISDSEPAAIFTLPKGKPATAAAAGMWQTAPARWHVVCMV